MNRLRLERRRMVNEAVCRMIGHDYLKKVVSHFKDREFSAGCYPANDCQRCGHRWTKEELFAIKGGVR